MFKLHFDKRLSVFSIRRADRSIVCVSERNPKLPRIGASVAVAPRVHVLVTHNEFKRAQDGSRPVLSVAVTRFPFFRLVLKRIKEVFV